MAKDKTNAQTLTLRAEESHFKDVKTDVSVPHVCLSYSFLGFKKLCDIIYLTL